MLVVLYDATQEAQQKCQYLINCGIIYVKANEFHMRIRTHYQYCQQSDCVMNYEESLTIQKIGIQALMSQMKKKDSSSFESIDDFAPSPDRNNTLLGSNNSLSLPEGDILTEPE